MKERKSKTKGGKHTEKGEEKQRINRASAREMGKSPKLGQQVSGRISVNGNVNGIGKSKLEEKQKRTATAACWRSR